jgi:hypothetical protein
MKRQRGIQESSSRTATVRWRTGSRWISCHLVLALTPLLIPAEQGHERPNSKSRFQGRSIRHIKYNPHNPNNKVTLIASSLAGSSNYSVRSTAGSRPKDDFQITYKFPENHETVLDDFGFDITKPPSAKNKPPADALKALDSIPSPAVDTGNSNNSSIWNRFGRPWTITALVSGIFCALVQAAATSNHNFEKQQQKRRPFSWIKAGGETATTVNSSASQKTTKPLSKKTEKKPTSVRKPKPKNRPFKKPSTKKYTTPADHHPLSLQSHAMIQKHGIGKWLFSPEKLPWALSALVSLFYMLALISRVSCDVDPTNPATVLCWKPLTDMTASLHEGFCVWGANPTTGVCTSADANSHRWSFQVDTVLAILTLVMGLAVHANWAAGIAVLIFVHGLLHLGISNGELCTDSVTAAPSWKHCLLACPGTQPTPTQPWQWILYALYNLGLVTLDVSVANFRLPLSLKYSWTIVLTALFVGFGYSMGPQWALPAVFVQSHALVSFTGIFANQDKITPLMGWCFLLATIVGLVEFLACEPLLLPHAYGHVAYDATLHIAMMASLIPRPHR